MKINPKFLAKLKEFCTDEQEISKGLHFGFLYTHKDEFPHLEEYFLEGSTSVFPYEDYQIYAINLTKKDLETGEVRLLIPLYAYEDNGEFEEFMTLLARLHVSSTGHFNKKLDYSIFNPTDKNAFFQLKTKLGDQFDLVQLATVVAKYYETTGYAKNLTNYLSASCYQDYMTYG